MNENTHTQYRRASTPAQRFYGHTHGCMLTPHTAQMYNSTHNNHKDSQSYAHTRVRLYGLFSQPHIECIFYVGLSQGRNLGWLNTTICNCLGEAGTIASYGCYPAFMVQCGKKKRLHLNYGHCTRWLNYRIWHIFSALTL